jgi:hypothetical protein
MLPKAAGNRYDPFRRQSYLRFRSTLRLFRKKGRLRRLTIAVLIGLVVAYFVTPGLLRHLVKSRLQSMIAAQLDADLEFEKLTYHFPYAIDVTNASLTARGTADTKPFQLIHVSHLAIELAKSPLRSGPLVIESVLIEEPSIHVIKDHHGLIGRRAAGAGPAGGPDKPKPKDWKLSQMFQLRRLSLRGGKAVYEDQSIDNTVPLVWENLNFDVDTVPLSSSAYAFHLVTDNAPQASFDAVGSADVDALTINIEKGTLNLDADSARERSALPPEVQQLVRRMNLHGALSINTKANVLLTDLRKSTYDTTLELSKASAAPPQIGNPIDKVTAKLRIHGDGGKPSLTLAYVNAASGGVDLRLEGGSVDFDSTSLEWKLAGLTGHLNAAAIPGGRLAGDMDFAVDGAAPLFAKNIREFRGQVKVTPHQLRTIPHLFPDPIDQFTEATFTLANGTVSARQLRAGYRDDVWFIKSAEIDLGNLPREVVVNHFEGCLTFSANRGKYPAAIEEIFAQTNPVGPWFIDASMVKVPLAAPEKADYHAVVRTPNGQLSLNNRRIAVFNINTAITVVPGIVRVDHFDAASLQGELHATGWAQPAKGGAYDFNAKIDGVEMHDILMSTQKPGAKPVPLSGRADVVAHLFGVIPAGNQPFIDALRGDGSFSVENGNFWQIPLFQDVAKSANVQNDSMTVGDAFGKYTIAHSTLHLEPFAVSAPILGVDGSGDVTFKGFVDLNLVAIPGQIGKTNGKNAIGNVLASAQNIFGVLSKQVLYRITVKGPIDPPPKIGSTLVAAEEITNLLDKLKGQQKDANAPAK